MKKNDILTMWIPEGEGFRSILVTKEIAQKHGLKHGSMITYKKAAELAVEELGMLKAEVELQEAIEKDYE